MIKKYILFQTKYPPQKNPQNPSPNIANNSKSLDFKPTLLYNSKQYQKKERGNNYDIQF